MAVTGGSSTCAIRWSASWALAYGSMKLTTDPSLRLNAYTAEPGSVSQDAPSLLATWTAAPHERPAIRPAG
jgi:hypothetical protein